MSFRPPLELTLTHGASTVRLRPSLGAAVTLERLHDGFTSLFNNLAATNTSTCAAVVLATATSPRDARDYLASIAERPLREFREVARGPLAEVCLALIPEPADDAPEPTGEPRAPVAWAEFFRTLYGYATGWLGWTPAEAWAASPQEIADAFAAHADMLRILHGTPDEDDADGPDAAQRAQNVAQGLDPDFDRHGLHALLGAA